MFHIFKVRVADFGETVLVGGCDAFKMRNCSGEMSSRSGGMGEAACLKSKCPKKLKFPNEIQMNNYKG